MECKNESSQAKKDGQNRRARTSYAKRKAKLLKEKTLDRIVGYQFESALDPVEVNKAIDTNMITLDDVKDWYNYRFGLNTDEIPWHTISAVTLNKLEMYLPKVPEKNKNEMDEKKKILIKQPIRKKITAIQQPLPEKKVYKFPMKDLVIGAKNAKDGTSIKEESLTRYGSALEQIMAELQITDVNEFGKELTDVGKIIGIMKGLNAKDWHQYIYPLEMLSKYSPTYCHYLNGVIDQYKMARDVKYLNSLINERRRNPPSKQLKLTYDEAKKIVEKQRRKDEKGMGYLLSILMVEMPPLRDDWGNIRICKSNPIMLKGKRYNYYNLNERTLYLFDYKLSDKKGDTKLILSLDIHQKILVSLRDFPRQYLITRLDGKIYANGSLSSFIQNELGYSHDDFREAYTTYVIENPEISDEMKVKLIRASLHDLKDAVNYYYYPSQKVKATENERKVIKNPITRQLWKSYLKVCEKDKPITDQKMKIMEYLELFGYNLDPNAHDRGAQEWEKLLNEAQINDLVGIVKYIDKKNRGDD